MEEQLTTSQVAEALQVSESSVKRWCNRGVIPTVRTLGGHRRIPLAGLARYLESTNQKLVLPLKRSETPPGPAPAKTEDEVSSSESILNSFTNALADGDEETCRESLTRFYAQRESTAELADALIAPAFQKLGDRWKCGELEIYQERRGCEIIARVLHELRRLIPDPPPAAPVAIGGSPAEDHYSIPGLLIDLVLLEGGWQSTNLGANLPLPTITAAARDYSAKLVWLSISHLENAENFVSLYESFQRSLPEGTNIILGGRVLDEDLRQRLVYTGFCDNMRQLARLSRGLQGRSNSGPLNF